MRYSQRSTLLPESKLSDVDSSLSDVKVSNTAGRVDEVCSRRLVENFPEVDESILEGEFGGGDVPDLERKRSKRERLVV